MVKSWFEEWKEEGIAESIKEGRLLGVLEGQILVLRRQLQSKFGPLSSGIITRLEAMPPERLEQLEMDILTAQSLEDLGLGEEHKNCA